MLYEYKNWALLSANGKVITVVYAASMASALQMHAHAVSAREATFEEARAYARSYD